MARSAKPRSPRFPASKGGDRSSHTDHRGVSADESVSADAESPLDLKRLLLREPSPDEVRSWEVMSPALRRRAADRIGLLRQWTGDRAGLTAVEAAVIAGVTPKRFYQMASAWKKEPGLLVVGAYAAAPVERAPRTDPLVNAALQKAVVEAVASGGGQSVEWLRRRVEELARARLQGDGTLEGDIRMPSPNLVRAIVIRELNRVGEARMMGESIAMDCCPTSMRSPTGEPHALFAIIDRGTLRVLGTAVGSLDRSVEGYVLAARRALVLIFASRHERMPWARRTRRADIVLGTDADACAEVIDRHRADGGAVEFRPVTRERRFGSQLRKYVGDRVGRVILRPSWVTGAPPMSEDEQVYTREEAAARADVEARFYNDTKALSRASGSTEIPDGLVQLLLTLAGPSTTVADAN